MNYSARKPKYKNASEELREDGIELECVSCTHCFRTTEQVYRTTERVYCPKCGENTHTIVEHF